MNAKFHWHYISVWSIDGDDSTIFQGMVQRAEVLVLSCH